MALTSNNRRMNIGQFLEESKQFLKGTSTPPFKYISKSLGKAILSKTPRFLPT